MSEASHLELARRMVAALDARDHRELDSLVHPDYRDHAVQLADTDPTRRIQVEDLIASGDRVVARVRRQRHPQRQRNTSAHLARCGRATRRALDGRPRGPVMTGRLARRGARRRPSARDVTKPLAVAVLAASLTLSSVAAGAPPVQERVVVDDAFTVPAGALCAFAVELRFSGKILVTMHFNADRSVAFISKRPNIEITATNPATERFLHDSDVGLDKQVFYPEGTSDVLSTGVHIKIRSSDGGIVFRQIGLQVIHLDDDGQFVSLDLVGGTFDPSDEFDSAVCGALT